MRIVRPTGTGDVLRRVNGETRPQPPEAISCVLVAIMCFCYVSLFLLHRFESACAHYIQLKILHYVEEIGK